MPDTEVYKINDKYAYLIRKGNTITLTTVTDTADAASVDTAIRTIASE